MAGGDGQVWSTKPRTWQVKVTPMKRRRTMLTHMRNVLITGIGGGVALMAAMFVIGTGANVWVTSGDQAKIDKAIGIGAKGGVNYKEEGWAKKLLDMLPKATKQFDAIVDGAGGRIIEMAPKLLKVRLSKYSNLKTAGELITMPLGRRYSICLWHDDRSEDAVRNASGAEEH